ncbi:MAG TPA: o-succinylbenzoate--CoA ligase [Chloroflexota bacterium]|nr:o-succinylbenzoate--CoA ligase [Chloroflexota bacterium]
MIDPQRECLPEWLRQRTRLTGSRLAVIAEEVTWTYRELDERATYTAGQFAALGVTSGDRIAILSWNCPEYVVVVHALARLQATLVPLNARLSETELAWQVGDADVRVLVHDPSHAEVARGLANNRPALTTAILAKPNDRGVLAGIDAVSVSACDSVALDQPHSIIYTSGTTGQPKGAVLSYRNYWWSAIGSALNLGLREDDRWLACLPLFHVGGLSIVLRSVIYGTGAVIQAGFDASAVNRAIDEEGVTVISVVSTMLQRMLDAHGDRRYPDSLRCVLIGGGPVPEPLLDRAWRLGVPVVQTYGLTETASQIATLAPEDARRKLGSAGKALFHSELRIEREEENVVPGVVGEIVVRGPSVTTGYVNRPDATARAFRNGWFHTGDLGYLDDEGYLYVVDRRDDLIVTGGENVYPAEVEAVLLAHPAVDEAGVVGIPDSVWGQLPVAALKLRAGHQLTVDEVQRFCRERLAGYKIPKEIRVLDSLPRNATGKLLRRVLRDSWGGLGTCQ